MQRVAVLHLEEKCQRAIEWALKIEPSVKYLVREIKFLISIHRVVLCRVLDFMLIVALFWFEF